jgi:hypothetical protein
MRRKLEIEVSSCWECPFMQYVRGSDIAVLDGWSCHHPSGRNRQVIDQRHRSDFADQYPKGFPTWCPLPITEDHAETPVKKEHKPSEKWVLTNASRFDLKDCAAYALAESTGWNFFAIRSGTGRTTAESYLEYKNFEEIQEMFNRVYGFGAEWKSEPMKPVATRKK